MAYCQKCGKQVFGQNAMCSDCEGRPSGSGIDYAMLASLQQAERAKKKKILFFLVPVVAIVVISIAYFGIQGISKHNLQSKLQSHTWVDYDGDTKLMLDFKDDKIDYSGDFGILGEQDIGSGIPYKVIDSNTIEVYSGRKINVKVENDGGDTIVTFTPSFVNSDTFSVWIND
jgi:hypothetical protein